MIRTGGRRRPVPGGPEAHAGVDAPQDAGAPGGLDVPGGPEVPAGPGERADLTGGAAGGGAIGDGANGGHAGGDGADTMGRPRAPRWLEMAGAWSWRLIVVGIVIYFGARAVSALRIVVLPCVGALLLTALLQPLAARLRRVGMNALAATWCTLLLAIAVLAGAGTLVGIRVSQESGTLASELTRSAHQFEHWLVTGPFHVRQHAIQQFSNSVLTWFNQHRSLVAGTVVTGGRIALEIVAGLVLMLFITFFLIKDGDRIWRWMTRALGSPGARRADRAGREAWLTLVHYIRGTVVVAAIHAAVIGLALLIIGVPLVGPLTLLVFLASFVPLIGILVAGFVAILVTLGTKGLIAAIVLLAIFILENQVESHLLQPLVVGRMVRLHPLAIILVLAVGGVVGGIPGAIVAVPTAAAITRAWPLLRDAPPGEDEAADGARASKVAAGEPDRT
ncbi:MAG: AI-2E family transporter [Micromonosporaceae bacterium]